MEQKSIPGSCLCGEVRFELTPPLRPVIGCHCHTCRKTTGHYWAATAVAKERLHFVTSHGLTWFNSSSDIKRGFCRNCGSSLFYDSEKRDYIAISAGALDAEELPPMIEHVFCEEKGDYYEITDGLPVSAQWSERFLSLTQKAQTSEQDVAQQDSEAGGY